MTGIGSIADGFSELSTWAQISVISTVWLVAGTASVLLLSRRPARAHLMMVAAMACAVACPALWIVAQRAGWGFLPAVAPGEIGLAGSLEGAPVVATPGSGISGFAILGFVAASGTVFFLARLALSVRRGAGLASAESEAADPSTLELLNIERARMGITRSVRVRTSARARAPMIWCWGRAATLLLPPDWSASRRGSRAVLRHELAHLERADHRWCLLADLCVCVLWWNPLAWWCRASARELSERACDTWALSTRSSPTDYAEVLLSFARPANSGAALGAVRSRRGLERRIRRLLCAPATDPRAGACWILAMVCVVGLSATGVSLAQRRAPSNTSIDIPASIRPAAFEEPEIDVHGAALQFGPEVLDLGTVPPGGSGTGVAFLLNTGAEPIDILDYKASCGCTSVYGFEARRLEPGEAMELLITMTAPEDGGEFKEKVVRVRARGFEEIELPVRLVTGGAAPARTAR